MTLETLYAVEQTASRSEDAPSCTAPLRCPRTGSTSRINIRGAAQLTWTTAPSCSPSVMVPVHRLP
ncbi:major surface protease gp63, putative [Leishmania tarentolae]|uniref:Major surface protease gp63, putative n=1 Tax=Leishmania tarentolae TaxID=5689 RepID=A0A640KWJ0_LEITA|nr:major surface protease gp63, putative [Leishmania tarentolae]